MSGRCSFGAGLAAHASTRTIILCRVYADAADAATSALLLNLLNDNPAGPKSATETERFLRCAARSKALF